MYLRIERTSNLQERKFVLFLTIVKLKRYKLQIIFEIFHRYICITATKL